MSKNVQIMGKIVQVDEVDGMITLLIGEHQGIFRPTGRMRIQFDGQATIDLHREMEKRKIKGGNLVGMIKRALEGKPVEINLFPYAG